MIFPGNVKSMGQYTMTTQPGALSRAAFEEPVDMLVSTALSGKRDDLSGCSSAAVCGITPQIGTGCNFHLRVTLTEMTQWRVQITINKKTILKKFNSF